MDKEKLPKDVDIATIFVAILYITVFISVMWHCETENITLTNLVFGPDVNSSSIIELLLFVGGGMLIGGIVGVIKKGMYIVFKRKGD